MNRKSALTVVLVLIVVGGVLKLDRDSLNYHKDESDDGHFVEYASILWIARVYASQIEFVSANRVFYTKQFEFGEKHVDSMSYRNLNGYFDPVFVTVWRRAQSYKALVIDPFRELELLRIDSDGEIDVSISRDNKILIGYTKKKSSTDQDTDELVVVWPSASTSGGGTPL